MPYRHTEEDFWNDYYDAKDAAERDAMTYAEEMADMYEWDSDDDRDAYIAETYLAQLAANEKAL